MRFVVEDARLAHDLKLLRHDLAGVMGHIDRILLLSNRDTVGDIGTDIKVDSEYRRCTPVDVLTAASQRIQQSLRCIEEYLKLVRPDLAVAIEPLRYRAYDCLAAVELLALKSNPGELDLFLEGARLYLLVDCQLSQNDFAARIDQLSKAGVDLIQIRDKQADSRKLLEYTRIAMEAVDRNITRIVVNDRLDIAMVAASDFVHVGQEDIGIEEVRKISSKIGVGVSTHSIEQARLASKSGASYIGCGPTFPSSTKIFEDFPGLQFLQQVAEEIALPCFAIGGITLERLSDVMATGVKRVAVSAAIWKASDPISMAAKFADQLKRA